MYIAILRGINVSGRHLIKMEALKHSFQLLGFQQVTTYIQSGNIVFQSNIKDIFTLEAQVKNMIQHDFGYDIPCIVIHIDQLKNIIDQNPLLEDVYKNNAHFHVTLLSSVPKIHDITSISTKKQVDEEVFLVDRAIYLYCPNGYGKTKLTNNFIESKLQITATTRNWRTLQELLKIASK